MGVDIKPTSPSSQSSGLGLVFFVVGMLMANIWLFQKSFGGEPNRLPQVKLSPFSTAAAILNRPNPAGFGLDKPVNILVLGKSGGQYIAPNLTDTIFVARLSPQPSPQLKIISIPRDLAVKNPDKKSTLKINSLYQLGLRKSQLEGLSLVKTKVEEITGLKTNYFVLFDLATVEKIIDDIGGVNVTISEDIYDPRFPSESGGYETFRLASGLRYLNGKTALRVIRTRASPQGDFDRIKRQQAVLKAIKGKLLSLNPIWDFPKLWGIFRTAQKNIYANLQLGDLKDLWALAKQVDLDHVQTLNLDLESGLVAEQKTNWNGQAVYILVAKDKPLSILV